MTTPARARRSAERTTASLWPTLRICPHKPTATAGPGGRDDGGHHRRGDTRADPPGATGARANRPGSGHLLRRASRLLAWRRQVSQPPLMHGRGDRVRLRPPPGRVDARHRRRMGLRPRSRRGVRRRHRARPRAGPGAHRARVRMRGPCRHGRDHGHGRLPGARAPGPADGTSGRHVRRRRSGAGRDQAREVRGGARAAACRRHGSPTTGCGRA